MIMENGLNFYVKKNRQIVCNDNEEWAEFLCKCNRCVLVLTGKQSPYSISFTPSITVDLSLTVLDNHRHFNTG